MKSRRSDTRPRGSTSKDDLAFYLKALGFEEEVPFKGLTGKRKWRWDWAKGEVAVEYHGLGPGHQSVRGVWRDHEKVTEGNLSGLVVIQCNVDSVSSGRCFDWIDIALQKERGQPIG